LPGAIFWARTNRLVDTARKASAPLASELAAS
jgi:hypothetical protein